MQWPFMMGNWYAVIAKKISRARSLRWKTIAESIVRWFVVREKHCSGWKNKLKSTDYKTSEQCPNHYFLLPRIRLGPTEYLGRVWLGSICSSPTREPEPERRSHKSRLRVCMHKRAPAPLEHGQKPLLRRSCCGARAGARPNTALDLISAPNSGFDFSRCTTPIHCI
jgi:hypothetical protein